MHACRADSEHKNYPTSGSRGLLMRLVQMDRMGANFFRTVDMIVSNLAAKPLVLTLPIGAEDNFDVRF
jgi:hypothetical protein